jgi:hypothetical protein
MRDWVGVGSAQLEVRCTLATSRGLSFEVVKARYLLLKK